MYAYIHEIEPGFFEGLCPPSSATAHLHGHPLANMRLRHKFINVVVAAVLNALDVL
jgi:hypothetical protein